MIKYSGGGERGWGGVVVFTSEIFSANSHRNRYSNTTLQKKRSNSLSLRIMYRYCNMDQAVTIKNEMIKGGIISSSITACIVRLDLSFKYYT